VVLRTNLLYVGTYRSTMCFVSALPTIDY